MQRGLVSVLTLCLVLSGPGRIEAAEAGPTVLVDQAVRDACGKRVVLLGEPPMHGFGRTLELKVEIARRLVDECHFNAFFLESGAYDFLNIQKVLKAGKTLSDPTVAAAIGGIWAVREVEPLVPFLREKAQGGALVLGGLDDQLGRGSYAQQQMPADLVEYLQGDDKANCLAVLQRHTLWQYTNDSPYSPKDRTMIVGCLDKIESHLSSAAAKAASAHDLAMIGNLRRLFDRDFPDESQPAIDRAANSFNARDRSMYLNFQWFASRLPEHRKIIVWTATTHASKDSAGVPGQEKFLPLGTYIRREFKDDAFVLAFTAYSGSYALGRQPARTLIAAPADSIEARALDKTDSGARYFSASEIRKLGTSPARPLGPDFKIANWSDVLDALVVLREEHPPSPIER